MKRCHPRARDRTFQPALRDVLFVNIWGGLVLYAVVRAIID
jgi:hypothetical protein